MKFIGRLIINTIIFFVIGAFITIMGITVYKTILSNDKTVIKASIVEVNASALTLSYNVNDKEYSDEVIALPFAKYNKGDKIEVYYNNSNPSKVNIKDSLAAMVAIPVCVCLTLLFNETVYKVDFEEEPIESLQK